MISGKFSKVVLCVGIVLYRKSLTEVSSYEITREAYMGQIWQNNYIVHSERKSWLDARNVCKTNGFAMQFKKWKTINQYIIIKAERKGWNASEDVWFGLIKHPNSSLWYECRKYHCVEANIVIPGQLFYERQCAVLNMSSATKSNILYADNCEGNAFGFACLGQYGTVPNDVEMYPMSDLVETGTYRESWNNVNITECAINSFSIFFCFASTYYPETRICNAECTNVLNVPENVTLINSVINSTILLRSYNRVIINNDVTNLPPITDPDQFPCVYETSSKIESTPLSSAMSTSVYTTGPVVSHCLCICTTVSNITKEGLQQKISQIKKSLTVNKTSLSSSLRRKTSAPDERQSSAGMGVVGMFIIIGTLFALIASDLFYAGFIIIRYITNNCFKWQ
eukprot:XP_011441213.1 PREDICTED: uncharacterized protein LOC105337960 [Crassostrea gigas]